MSSVRSELDDLIATTTACTTIGIPLSSRKRADVFTKHEWNRLAKWLDQTQMRPADLLFPGIAADIDSSALDPRIKEKALTIADRASATYQAMEELREQGIWTVCRADDIYPEQWEKRINAARPPVIFGAGSKLLLGARAIAIVGSREIVKDLVDTAESIGAAASGADLSVISGAARGTDQFGMLGALKAHGQSLGILPGSLARTAKEGRWREYIADDRLCLVSHVNPKTGFVVGNAMERNRLVYTLAELTIVISTGDGTGGTWEGANKNLKRGWAPLAVWTGDGAPAANQKLIELGAFPFSEIPDSRESMNTLIHEAKAKFALKATPPNSSRSSEPASFLADSASPDVRREEIQENGTSALKAKSGEPYA